MSDGPEGGQGPSCGHGVPQGVACAECIGEVVRRILGGAAAREAAAPTPLMASAVQSHEMLLAHIAAGFSRAEAMQVVLMVYAVTMFRAPPA
jgi:hypothetical protein